MTRVLVLLALVLAACGGGASAPPSPASLAERIGCTDYEVTTGGQVELGAREEASCTLGDERLTILTYKSNGPRDEAQSIADQFGGGIAVAGDRFTVRVDTQAMAERVRAAVGGEIR